MSSKPSSRIAEEDKVPFWGKVAYASAAPVDWFAVGLAFWVLWMPIWNIGYGIGPGILGLILMVYRAWDALADPFMGTLSDNTRTRWGRRRPYIFIGAILCALMIPLLWNPPEFVQNWQPTLPFVGQDHEISGLVIYITGIGLILFTCFTVWAMPYYSLMLEMTPSYDERTRIAGFRSGFTQLGIFAGSWVLALASSNFFLSEQTGEPDVTKGIGVVSFGIAGLVLILGVLPAIFMKERYYKKETVKQKSIPLMKGIRDTMNIKPFWMLSGFIVLTMFGQGIVSKLGIYLNIYFVNEGGLQNSYMIEGWKGSVMAVAGIASIPFWTWICEKFDKKWAMFAILVSSFFGAFLNFFCYNPDLPYLQLIPAAFQSGVVSAIWLIVPSMQADVVDYDEVATHKRREGSVNSVFSWFLKMAMTLAAGLSGYIIEWTGFDVGLGSEQPEGVLARMLLYLVFLPLIFYAIAAYLIWIYPLDRKTMHEIRDRLENRRGRL